MRVLCQRQPTGDSVLNAFQAAFSVYRPKSGEKLRTLGEMLEIAGRSTHEEELFSAADWDFVSWLGEAYPDRKDSTEPMLLTGVELLQWLARWGQSGRLEPVNAGESFQFHGQMVELIPHLRNIEGEVTFGHRLQIPGGAQIELKDAVFFAGHPLMTLIGSQFYLVRNPPPGSLLVSWLATPLIPVRKLSHRLLKQLRTLGPSEDSDWRRLCTAHAAKPEFTFELNDEVVRLRLLARSELDQTLWQWNGEEWQRTAQTAPEEKPTILDDPRLDPAIAWLRRLDWFTPEPGLWVGDANENFLDALAQAWPDRPESAEYLGNPAFHRLFLAPRRLRPKLIVQGSGIDWFSVCAAWEAEGLKLTPADLQRLQSATGRFVKLPDSGWMELDCTSVRNCARGHGDLGLDSLTPVPQRVPLLHAAQASQETLRQFIEPSHVKSLRERLTDFTGIPSTPIPPGVQAELRPYQKDGFDFLCHLTQLQLGGILADDMGLGKTLQTLDLAGVAAERRSKNPKPSLVICPASVLHNWRREANRFTPDLKVLVLESGAARHNLRKQIPQHDFIVTNYALLRRDLEALQKFAFRAIILDEAQFIKNPGAQVTQSVKQLKRRTSPRAHRHAAGKPAARSCGASSISSNRAISATQEQFHRNLRTARRGRRMRAQRIARTPSLGQAAPAAAAAPEEACGARTCRTASSNGATASWAKSSANFIWPNCAAAASR